MNEEAIVSMQELEDFSLVHLATRGDLATVNRSSKGKLPVALPEPGNATANGELRALWIGPGRWLLHAEAAGWQPDEIPGTTATTLTDSRRIFRLEGDGTRDWLASHCPLDLRDTALPAGAAATTLFEHFAVLLYRADQACYDVYVEQSYCEDFLAALSD